MKKVTLTRPQSKFFDLVFNAALKDKELSHFITEAATGKTFVMEYIQNALRSVDQASTTLELSDEQTEGVKSSISKMVEGGEWLG